MYKDCRPTIWEEDAPAWSKCKGKWTLVRMPSDEAEMPYLDGTLSYIKQRKTGV